MQTRVLYVDTKRLTCFIIREAKKRLPCAKGAVAFYMRLRDCIKSNHEHKANLLSPQFRCAQQLPLITL